jgi:two-component system, OmpR family, KDP operon response regulator KdpE
MTSAKILIVDDEPQIRRVLRTTLTSQGYTVAEAKSGDEALEMIRDERPDLILLDVNMPGRSGLETCREIRATGDVPIIMLTVRNTEKDKVQALDAGADDYVVKPFGSEELMARMRAALRRMAPAESLPPFVSGDLKIDFEKRSVTVKGEPVRLTPKEFDLLRQLVANQGKAIGHRRLLQAVWGPDYGEETEYLRVFINQLRKKIEPDPHNPRYIHTEPWVGYRFERPQEKARSGRGEKTSEKADD